MDLSCPKYGQIFLATFRTSHTNVRNRASINWPYSGHERSMSGIWTVLNGPVPDIDLSCPQYGQFILAVFRTSICDVWNRARIFGLIPDIAGHVPDIAGHVPDIAGHVPDIRFHGFLKAGHIPDIILRCPE